jgi:hypothetical protein
VASAGEGGAGGAGEDSVWHCPDSLQAAWDAVSVLWGPHFYNRFIWGTIYHILAMMMEGLDVEISVLLI